MEKSNYLIPDYVFKDIKNAIVFKNDRPLFSGNRFKFKSSPETKDWFKSFKYSPRYVAIFVMQDKHEVIPICCKTCGKELKEKSAIDGMVFCSIKCSANHPNTAKKRQTTMIDRYGVDNPSKSEVFQNKKSETYFKHYGVSHYTQTKEFKDTLRNHFIEKYVNHPEIGQEILEKIRNTKTKKYGEDYERITCEKSRKTMIERYGVDNPFKLKEIQTLAKMSRRKSCFNMFVQSLNRKHIILLSSPEDYYNLKPLRFRCTSCGREWTTDGQCGNANEINCSACDRHLVSRAEKELLNFVKSIYQGTILENDRKFLENHQELDIVIPDKKVAIEFDGNFYHSDLFKERDYHLNKTKICEEKGYRLIHVFEYDWIYHRPVIESIIASALGIFSKRLYARQCEVVELNSADYKNFLEENHLQTPINSSLRFGLEFDGELVAVIGYGYSRFKKGEYELHRFCVKRNYQVVGALSKLIKHSGIQNFVSYVDRSHFTGKGYFACGFKLIGITKPNYVYTKYYNYKTRLACQKHKLPKLLGEGFDPNKSEYENMTMNGWNRIYDCGNLKLQYTVK